MDLFLTMFYTINSSPFLIFWLVTNSVQVPLIRISLFDDLSIITHYEIAVNDLIALPWHYVFFQWAVSRLCGSFIHKLMSHVTSLMLQSMEHNVPLHTETLSLNLSPTWQHAVLCNNMCNLGFLWPCKLDWPSPCFKVTNNKLQWYVVDPWLNKVKLTRAGFEPTTSELTCRHSTNWAI